MAHTHRDVHDIDIVERDGGSGLTAGVLVAIAALVVFAVIALAVLFARPWDDNGANNTPNVPGVTDNSGGGASGGATGGGNSSGGASNGGAPQPAQ